MGTKFQQSTTINNLAWGGTFSGFKNYYVFISMNLCHFFLNLCLLRLLCDFPSVDLFLIMYIRMHLRVIMNLVLKQIPYSSGVIDFQLSDFIPNIYWQLRCHGNSIIRLCLIYIDQSISNKRFTVSESLWHTRHANACSALNNRCINVVIHLCFNP